MPKHITFYPKSTEDFLKRLVFWVADKNCFCVLGDIKNKGTFSGHQGFPILAGVGSMSEIKADTHTEDGFNLIKKFSDNKGNILMGYLSYDLKNQTEKLNSENFDGVEMPLLYFFEPEITFSFSDNNGIEVVYSGEDKSDEQIIGLCKNIDAICLTENFDQAEKIVPLSRVSKEKYIENILKIKEHIQLGDVYELNYCIEFFAENAEVDPIRIYEKLNTISPAPFSCFLKTESKYLICASPERFLKKQGSQIIAQPMKGTARRSSNETEDAEMKEKLFQSEKERAENVMIVDLVRNDLSKTAKKMSVKVDELYGIYTFPQVHQMISTISSEMKEDTNSIDVIKSAFPMGSMTGAPKVKAMELIEKFETTKRGLFSGAVGYISPEGDFDFNVVIRSIQYNADKKYLSFMVGSAITINSDPEKEYEECLLKAQALIQALK